MHSGCKLLYRRGEGSSGRRIADEDKGWYLRLDDAKAKLAPPSGAQWFEREGIEIPRTIGSEEVGALIPWEPPENPLHVTTATALQILNIIDSRWKAGKPFGKQGDGTGVLVGQRCAELCHASDGADGAIVFREIDRVRVVGRKTPERLFEPVGTGDDISAGQRERLSLFADGLADYRARNFEDAGGKFETLQDDDPVARVYVKRIRGFFATPLPPEWDGVTDLSEKG